MNVNGLASKLNYGLLDLHCVPYDIVIFSETLDDNPNCRQSLLANYSPFIKQKTTESHNYGGIHGLCIFVRDDLVNYTESIEENESECIIWLKIDKVVLGYELLLGGVYIPGEGSRFYDHDVYEKIENDIVNFKSLHSEARLCLMGDFNSRTGLLDDCCEIDNQILEASGFSHSNEVNVIDYLIECGIPESRCNQDKNVNNNGRKLIELCNISDLKIVNGRVPSDNLGEFTCYNKNGGKSVVDYGIVSYQLFPFITNFNVDVFDSCLSDVHCPISIELSSTLENSTGNTDIPNCDESKVGEEYVSPSFKWDESSKQDYSKGLADSDLKCLTDALSEAIEDTNQNSIDHICNKMNKLFIDVAWEKNVFEEKRKLPSKSKCNKPWFDKECQEKRSEYFKIKNRLKKINNEECRAQLKLEAQKYKKVLKAKSKVYFKKLNCKIRNLKSNNSKEYWNLINRSSQSKKIMLDLSLEVFSDHFKKLSTVDKEDENEKDKLTEVDKDSIDQELNVDFTLEEIQKLIKQLRNNKACGIDQIRNEFLKCCNDDLMKIIVNFFNLVLNSGIIPASWCEGLIVPLYKNKGSLKDPDNYRGITLLSCVGKLFTAALNNRVKNFLDSRGIIGDEQAGFRDGFSTIDHIFALNSIIELYMSKRKKLFCAFIDYKKAFDLVDRTSLWCKLISEGVNGKILNVIFNLYKNAKSCVMLNRKTSKFFNCNVGVRQGENLSPLLFAIYLNDFEYHISRKYSGLKSLSEDINEGLSDEDLEVFLRLYALLYADDTIVMAESEAELQLALNAVKDYCDLWKLKVNTTKTKIVIFSKGKIRKIPKFKFGEEKLVVEFSYNYLGTLFNYNGNFQPAIAKQVKQAKKAAFSLKSKIKALQLSVDLQIELFDKTVVPVLLYGCEVWGCADIKQIEVYYRKILKQVLNVKNYTPNCMVYGESGTYPLDGLIKSKMCAYWCRLLTGSRHKISYLLYKIIRCHHYDQDKEFQSKWIEKLESIFNETGMANLWLNEMDGFNTEYIKCALKLRLNDIRRQKLESEIQENSMCSNYRIFKTNLGIEEYLMKLDYNERINLCKFRSRNHNLPITNTRFFEDKEANRHLTFCTKCNKNKVGDEMHYLLECSFFEEERLKFLNRRIFINPNIYTMQNMLCTKNVSKLKKLSKFVKNIMDVFVPVVEILDLNDDVVNLPTSTRGGRPVRKPERLDL